ncbi:MAG: hypothetical protein WAV41_00800 [Microgenomates group bacterium]
MAQNYSSRGTPVVTILAIAFLIFLSVWFVRGESFRLYASLFFGLYYLTKTSWLSIILVSIVQNIFFLPFRIISERFYVDLKDFEHELTKSKGDEQSFVLKKQIRSGNLSVIFYIINFVLFFIAFISAGRVFFLEFYHTPIAQHWLYSWVPYPTYPLQGVIFNFPFFRATGTFALEWWTIAKIWLIPIGILALIRILWRLIKPFISGNQKLLETRIGINRFKLLTSGFMGTIFILSLYFFRHVPTGIQFYWLSADLSKQNTVFNIITAICTAFAAVYAGAQHNKETSIEARVRGIPEDIITRVNHAYLRQSVKNGILLGISALIVTRLMPCSHDLSVLAFEALYLMSPITFDLLIPKKRDRPVPATTST